MKFSFEDRSCLDDLCDILYTDDKEKFLPLLSAYSHTIISTDVVGLCALHNARKCLLAMIEGEAGITAHELYARLAPRDPYHQMPTPLACVSYYMHTEDDIIDLLLKRGPVDHANIKCRATSTMIEDPITCPLDHLLLSLCYHERLLPWSPGASLIKLIILLCQWDLQSSLNSARLLAPHTHGLNDIACSYVTEGRLAQLGALLLVAHEKVLAPFNSGLTIRQRIIELVDMCGSEFDLDHEGARYQSVLIEAYKLLDIFERAGGALSVYCSSMHEYVPPSKVLVDVASVLKKAGYALEPIDLDLRDCYRDCPELKHTSVFKLSDPGSRSNNYVLPSSLARAQGSSEAIRRYPYLGNCQLLHKLKLGPVLNLKSSASKPRLLSTAVDHVQNGCVGIPLKRLAYIAFRIKSGIKF